MSTPVGWRWRLPSDTKWQFTDGPEEPRLGLPTSFEAAAIKEPVYARSAPEAGKVLAEARERINRYADTAAEHDLVARIDALTGASE